MTTQTSRSTRRPFVAFAVLALGAATLTGILSRSHGAAFELYFGDIHPLFAIVLVTTAGVVSLTLLQSRGWFEVLDMRAGLRGVALSAVLATLFAVAAVIADVIFRFPEDMNVALPQSLLFYPAIAFVVEIVFHALPLAFLLVILSRCFPRLGTERLVWLCILLTSLLEPAFQVAFEERPLSPTGVYVWVHVFAFNVFQLAVFRRYDFVSMYAFRFCYYLCWHIAWGALRLHLLFQ